MKAFLTLAAALSISFASLADGGGGCDGCNNNNYNGGNGGYYPPVPTSPCPAGYTPVYDVIYKTYVCYAQHENGNG